MSEKNINVRVIHKHDTEVNWNKATNFIPKQGEIIVYDIDGTYSYERFKIGDGVTVVSSLPFIDDTKVDKVDGKGLSTNDYTTVEKDKLAGISDSADSVSFSQSATSGNKVGTITINGTNTDMYSPVQTTVSGNAGTATKLAKARTISLGTGATGTATSFDGSSNITIPVTSVKEAYISWGGKDIVGNFSPLDAAMVSELGANRFSFIRSPSIEIEYSNDNGTTWTDYGLSDSSKVALFSGISIPVAIGNSTKTNPATADSKLRITLTQKVSGLYNSFNKFVMLVSTNGSSGSTVTIQQALNSDLETWTDVKTASLSGWSGYNIINLSPSLTFGGGSTQVGKLRFVFSIDSQNSSYSGLQILSIGGYGGVGWTCPSTMAKTGHLYSYDSSQNVTFPSNITAKIFNGTLNGTSNRAVADSDGSNIISTYATKNDVSSTYATKTAVENSITQVKPKYATVTLPSSNWTGSASPWSQVVTISGVTANSKVDLQPTATQLIALQNSNIALMTENDNGVVTVYAINNKPTSDYTIQVIITEIEGVSA